MIGYQWFSAGVGLILAVFILALIRHNHLQIRYAIWWLLVAATALLFGFYPQLINLLGGLFGVGYPPVLLLVAGGAALLIKMLYMDIQHSRQQREIRRLTQRLAIWEADQSERGMKNSPEVSVHRGRQPSV